MPELPIELAETSFTTELQFHFFFQPFSRLSDRYLGLISNTACSRKDYVCCRRKPKELQTLTNMVLTGTRRVIWDWPEKAGSKWPEHKVE